MFASSLTEGHFMFPKYLLTLPIVSSLIFSIEIGERLRKYWSYLQAPSTTVSTDMELWKI